MDLNGDGVLDIVSGSYSGMLTLYAGNKAGGFDAPAEVKQVTDLNDRVNKFDYLYTNPTFSDYNGDGLLDAFTGGLYGPRIMINEGTATEPLFSERKPLLNVDGEPIIIFDKVAPDERITKEYHIFINHIDWDNDGVKDLITSVSYMYEGSIPLMFHKGVATSEGDRYEKPIPMIKSWGDEKVLPGKYLHLNILDYDGDGIKDILLGVSFDVNIESNTIYDDSVYGFMISKTSQVKNEMYKNLGDKYSGNRSDYAVAINTLNTLYKFIDVGNREYTENDRVRGYVLFIKGKK